MAVREYTLTYRWDDDSPLINRIANVVAEDSFKAEETLRSFLQLRHHGYDIITIIPAIVKETAEPKKIKMTIHKKSFWERLKAILA